MLYNNLVNGGWGEWTTWSSCSVSCGAGSRSKNRLCNNPTPAYGGNVCPGSADKVLEECNSNKCPGNISLFKRLYQRMPKILCVYIYINTFFYIFGPHF